MFSAVPREDAVPAYVCNASPNSVAEVSKLRAVSVFSFHAQASPGVTCRDVPLACPGDGVVHRETLGYTSVHIPGTPKVYETCCVPTVGFK